MTNEEAIKNIKEHCYFANLIPQAKEALDMAIKALEQEHVLDKIREEIEQLPTTECTETQMIFIIADDFKEDVLEILDKYKAESEDKK